jgi:hypothetical protein
MTGFPIRRAPPVEGCLGTEFIVVPPVLSIARVRLLPPLNALPKLPDGNPGLFVSNAVQLVCHLQQTELSNHLQKWFRSRIEPGAKRICQISL